jgi:hypothetical protein
MIGKMKRVKGLRRSEIRLECAEGARGEPFEGLCAPTSGGFTISEPGVFYWYRDVRSDA